MFIHPIDQQLIARNAPCARAQNVTYRAAQNVTYRVTQMSCGTWVVRDPHGVVVNGYDNHDAATLAAHGFNNQ